MATGRDRLFVYGSLKRGARHHAELGGAAFLGEARTDEGYGLVALGEYWALVEQPGSSGSVRGELFEVEQPLLARLDQFEGDDYRRGVIRLANLAEVTETETATETTDAKPVAVLVGQPAGAKDVREISLALAYLKRTR